MKECVALYGNVAIMRAYCPECHGIALVVQGDMACCGGPPGGIPDEFVRVSEPPLVRKLPPPSQRKHILAEQQGRCFWCDFPFGSWRRYKGKLRRLKIEWDHMLPWSHSRDNSVDNFVASCHLCNGIKSNLVFATVEEVRQHVESYYRRVREADLSGV